MTRPFTLPKYSKRTLAKILSDILLNSKLDPGAIERERDFIRKMAKVNKQLDHFHSAAFQGTGLGRTILGSEENIRLLSRDDLSKYIDTHYTQLHMVIAGAGAIDHDELCAIAGEGFGSLPTTPNDSLEVAMDPPSGVVLIEDGGKRENELLVILVLIVEEDEKEGDVLQQYPIR